MLIDTHCHLNHPLFADDAPAVIAQAEAAGVKRIIVVGYDMPSSEQAVLLAEDYAPLYAAVAVHPHDSKDYDGASDARLRVLAAHPKVVAIGEIGLDYHYDLSTREAQRTAFLAQISLAREAGLPIIIHCREAYADALDVLEQAHAGERGCVMHCWAGTREEAERALELGLYLGFGGVLTFKNAEGTRAAAASAPAQCLLVETDAPYLAPVPYRGKRNEPAHCRLAAEKLAELRGLPQEEAAAITTANAMRLFSRLV